MNQFGSVVLNPRITYFNSSYSASSVQIAYSMADGSALKSGIYNYNSALVFSTQSIGENVIMRNVSYNDVNGKKTTITHMITIQSIALPPTNNLKMLMQSNFSKGMDSWTIQKGIVGIASQLLQIYQNDSIVSYDTTYDTTGGVTFTSNLLSGFLSTTYDLGFVLLVDQNNYYKISLYPSMTITRIMNGQSVTLYTSGYKLTLTHVSLLYSSYKLYAEWTSTGVSIQLAKMGASANDYQVIATDTDPNAIQKFKLLKFGFYDRNPGNSKGATLRAQSVTIYQGKLMHNRNGVTYYVNQLSGSDSNDGLTPSTAWSTLNAAQYMLLPDDTLIVGDGVYRESLYFDRPTHSKHPITIKPLNPPTPASGNSKTYSAVLDGSLVIDPNNLEKVMTTPISIYKGQLQVSTSYIYANGEKLSLAMKPLPYDLDDEYDHTNYLTPKNVSYTINGMTYLDVDDMFKFDAAGNPVKDNFWVGADFYHYNQFGNAITPRPILYYNATTNTVGFDSIPPGITTPMGVVLRDSYAIANHIGSFSRSNQYTTDGNVIQVSLDKDPKVSGVTLEATALTNGISIVYGDGLTVQDMMFRKYASMGFFGQFTDSVKLLNSSAYGNGENGFSFRDATNIIVDGGKISYNHNNGVNYASMVNDSQIKNMYIYKNYNNGIWVGSGTQLAYSNWNILIKNNRVELQTSYRQHPDNIQFTNINNIVLEDNILINKLGNQNMWMEQNGLVIFRRNVFIGGPVGVNHAARVILHNNQFYQSFLRFAVKSDNSRCALIDSTTTSNWGTLFNSILNPTENGNNLVWSKNTILVSKIRSYSTASDLTATDKSDIINFINNVINDTNFMSVHKDFVLPQLDQDGLAYPYWTAITKRGLLSSSTGAFLYPNAGLSIIEEVRGLTRSILDELVFKAIFDSAMISYYPRSVSMKNNAFLDNTIQLVDLTIGTSTAKFDLLPYFDVDYNYVAILGSYFQGIWKPVIGPNTIFEPNYNNATYYFKDYLANDFRLRCDSNITLIDKGINVGMSYYGKAPDIGAYEMNCNGENPVNPILSTPIPQPSRKVSPGKSDRISSGNNIITTIALCLVFVQFLII